MALGKIAVLSTGHATAYGMFTAWREWSQKRGTIRLKELAEKERVDQVGFFSVCLELSLFFMFRAKCCRQNDRTSRGIISCFPGKARFDT
jgi:hypothetical protein